MPAKLVLVIALYAVCSVGPGFYLIRKADLAPIEKIVTALGISWLFIHLCFFTIYLLDLPRSACWIVSLVCCGLLAAAGRDLRNTLADDEARRALAWFGLIGAWTLGLLALIRSYSGGGWVGDWLEHYQRAVFFLRDLPLDTTFLDYSVPARPPMMNVVSAFFMAQAGEQFGVFQAVSALLNMSAFLAACLVCRLASRKWAAALPVLGALFMLNPMMAQNSTYSWTKLLAAFYVVSGICLYVAGTRGRSGLRLTLAFVFLVAGLLVHYSAAPYLIFVSIHYAGFVVWKREAGLREAALIALVCAALAGTWFGWSMAVYGAGSTVSSTSSVRDSAGLSAGGIALRVAENVWYTVVPGPLREAATGVVEQGNTLGYLRDFFFILYQSNALFAFGLLSAPLLLYQIYRAVSEARGGGASIGFWACLVAFSAVLGIAVHGTVVPLGLAHIGLQPIVVMGLGCLAAAFLAWPRRLKLLALAGVLVDLFLGIILHFRLQALTFQVIQSGPARGRVDMSDQYGPAAYLNWGMKLRSQVTFLGDTLQEQAPIVLAFVCGLAILSIALLIRSLEPAPAPAPVRAGGRPTGRRRG